MSVALPFSNERVAIVAITRHGIALASRVAAALPGASLFAPEKFRPEAETAAPEAAHCYEGKVGDQVPALFAGFDAIVAIVSLGAVVRLIAPHLGRKESDPAVVVVDEAGRFAIPALSGHLGGANALAGRLADALGAIPVLTTASDSRQTLAVDLLGRELGWCLEADHDAIVRASAAVVNDEPVALVQEASEPDWWRGHANGRSGPVPANIRLFDRLEAIDPDAFAAVLWVSHRPLPSPLAPALSGKLATYRPSMNRLKVALGLGCDRGTPAETIARAVDGALAVTGLEPHQVAAVASISLKADEPGLLDYAAGHGWEMVFYPPEQLATVTVPNPSETVRKYTGTPSVAEAAALLAAGNAQGATAEMSQLLIEKHKLRGADGRNATVSIARISYD